jgi:hypothetical protein
MNSNAYILAVKVDGQILHGQASDLVARNEQVRHGQQLQIFNM